MISAQRAGLGRIFGGFCMWTVFELRCPPGSVSIKDIKLNAKSRDDTPALANAREFQLLASLVPPVVDSQLNAAWGTRRPGVKAESHQWVNSDRYKRTNVDPADLSKQVIILKLSAHIWSAEVPHHQSVCNRDPCLTAFYCFGGSQVRPRHAYPSLSGDAS